MCQKLVLRAGCAAHQFARSFFHAHIFTQKVRTPSEQVLIIRPAGEASLRPKCGGKSGAAQQAQVLRSVGALAFCYCQCMRRVGSCSSACKNSSWSTSRRPWPRKSTCKLGTVVLSPFRAASQTTPALLFLPELPPEDDEGLSTNQASLQHSVDSEASLCALCCRSSPHLAMSPSLSAMRGGSRRSAGAAVSPDGGSNWMAA